MDKLHLKKINDATLQIETDQGIALELSEHFTFEVPNAKYTPAFKSGQWDGKIRLFNKRNNSIAFGLIEKIIDFANTRQYDVSISEDLKKPRLPASKRVLEEFINNIQIPEKIEKRDYQINSFFQMMKQQRGLLISPTGSGKSFMMYLMIRYFLEHDLDNKVLIVVPNVQLVSQLTKDFLFYSSIDDSFNEEDIHQIFSGKEKNTEKSVIISTWQSIFRLDKLWFEQFGMFLCDEVHAAKGASLQKISNNMSNAYVRIGTTGTLTADDSQVHELVLEGSFGPQYNAVKTKDLQDRNFLAKLDIQCLVLKHPEEDRKAFGKITYQDEINFLVSNRKRNNFIANLAVDQDDTNTLVLFNYVEKHGKPLFKLIQEKLPKERKDLCYYISGEIKVEERERIRGLLEKQQGAIICASLGSFSQGIDIKCLENIIFAAPIKSQIKVLQSIGRGLRISNNRNVTNLFDITDDITWKRRKNYTYNHGKKRIEIYNKEKFDFNIFPINL